MIITIGIIHLLLPLLLICYTLFFASIKYDKYMLMLLLSVPIGWIWCNNICSLSYIYCKYKKNEDANDIIDAQHFLKKHLDIDMSFMECIPYFTIAFGIFFIRLFVTKSVNPILVATSFIFMLSIDRLRRYYIKENKTFPIVHKIIYSVLGMILFYSIMNSTYNK